MIGPAILGQRLKPTYTPAATHMTFEGNSLADPLGGSVVAQLAALPPINGGITITNFALAGSTITDMLARAAQCDNSFQAGKVNYLFIWEFTNHIVGLSKTGAQAIADMTYYINQRLIRNPWKVVLLTVLPRGSNFGGSSYTPATAAPEIDYVNTYLRSHYRDMGASFLIEVRKPGGPFDFSDATNLSNYQAGLWADYTHPSPAGYTILAGYFAEALKRLPLR